MKEKYQLKGVVVSLNTPFDQFGKVDLASLEKLVEMHLDEGAVGFLTTAQAGEVYELTLAERLEIVRCVRAVTSNKATVIAGATARDKRESYSLAEFATRIGCDGVLVEPFESNKGNRQEISRFLQSFAAVGMPVLMVQDLDWVGQGLEVEFVAELFEQIEAFRSLKVEVASSGPKYSAVLAVTSGNLHVSGGWASLQLIEALDRGVNCFMPTAMTRLFNEVMRRYNDGDRDGAKTLFYSLLPVLAFTRQHLDVSIYFHKLLYFRRGLFRTPDVRKSTRHFDSFHARYAEEVLMYLDHIEKSGQ